jgi:hypothetical protein
MAADVTPPLTKIDILIAPLHNMESCCRDFVSSTGHPQGLLRSLVDFILTSLSQYGNRCFHV